MVGGRGTQVSIHHPLTAPPGRPRRDRAVSYRKRRWAVPSAAHCLPARGPSVPPRNTISVSPLAPAPPTHPGPPRRTGFRSPNCPGGTPGNGPGVGWGAGGEQAPHLAPEGREEGDLTNPEPPTVLMVHLGLSVWVGSQTEDTASAPSQRAESAEGLEAQRPFPGCPLIPLGPAWMPGKPALYLKPQPPPRPHRSPPPRSSGTGY